jgi:hypothetical protein
LQWVEGCVVVRSVLSSQLERDSALSLRTENGLIRGAILKSCSDSRSMWRR